MTKGKVLFGVFVLFIVFLFFWSLTKCFPFSSCPWSREEVKKNDAKVTLTFVGAWDDSDDWGKVISSFNTYELAQKGIDVQIKYEKLDSDNYESILLDRQINGEGPNIFMIFNSWLSKYQRRVEPLPEGYMSVKEFESTFAKVAEDDFVYDGEIYSLPLYVDTLALYYNKDIFRNAGYVDTPDDWDEFSDYVEGLTKLDDEGGVEILGAAIGGGEKVNRSQDIVMLLVMQNNTKSNVDNLYSFKSTEAQKAIKYYTDFADPDNKAFTWDYDNQIYSIDAFIQGKAAMSINYSYEIENIANKTGGTLDYGVALVPQQYENDKVNYASYWSPVVAKDATCYKDSDVTQSCADIAWDFLYFASQAKNVESYLERTGRPAANLSLAKEQYDSVDSDISPFAYQVLTAESWDNPYNDKTDEVLSEMIDSIITTDEDEKVSTEAAILSARNSVIELN